MDIYTYDKNVIGLMNTCNIGNGTFLKNIFPCPIYFMNFFIKVPKR